LEGIIVFSASLEKKKELLFVDNVACDANPSLQASPVHLLPHAMRERGNVAGQ
jgi:hypothetical protein